MTPSRQYTDTGIGLLRKDVALEQRVAEAGFASLSTPAAAQTPASATATTTSLPHSTTDLLAGVTTRPVSDTSTTPVAPLPSQTATSSTFSSTTTRTVVIVGAVVALVGGLVFLWFLFMAWKIHQAHKYPKQQYTPLSYQGSTASPQSGAPVNKSGLSKWAKIATVISPIFAIVGLAVAIYFGLKQQK
ncbi:hypothetical protein HO133_008444 [Letharia lupina]|uniref:Uncharacterized protein n=1 Tax=Letharia lupina TaxID=560253 RepID=A0A8H6CP62_9LECA|nr:uncharacterized protein HO133_008444 [Letharia lupina]KAF6227003.1 hypothetical protein HO133_008444 [Letharia lupina]